MDAGVELVLGVVGEGKIVREECGATPLHNTTLHLPEIGFVDGYVS
jgi:hypothetical protein